MRKCARVPDSWRSQALLVNHQDPGPSTCHDDERPFKYAFMQPTSITPPRRVVVSPKKKEVVLPSSSPLSVSFKDVASSTAHRSPQITQSGANIVGQVIILPGLTLYEGLHDTSCLRVCLRSSNGTRMNGDESRAKEPSSARGCLNLNQHHVQHASLRQVLPVVQA
jgi:hypothetical protein